ncbi:hypothetical protein M3N64_00095 [Sporolactobacillus sp. CPB3-1]|uniref:Uncharacterized protein n=1 Tax=Sporolactobacillus mangiferae TaxID=2940498 RepID=A0ABT0M667_9BACL|nr:hypothetical protein [Sporolactobacillus mangiferae]MCL1630356.1 hypothetical protein [Sporolactobacillus mangiferae]
MKARHPDDATLRRKLIVQQFTFRKNGIRELNPSELRDLKSNN